MPTAGNKDPYPSNWDFPGQGVAGNVAGAIGGFFSGGDNQSFVRNAPPGYKPASRAGGTGAGYRPVTGMATPSRTATPGGGFAAPPGLPYRTSGMAAGLGVPSAPPLGSIGAMSGPPNRTPQRSPYTPYSSGSRSTNFAQSRPYPAPSSGAGQTKYQIQQAAADRSASNQTVPQRRQDPHNWAGIARDLGNAGATGFRTYKTGSMGSTSAKNYARRQTAAAFLGGGDLPTYKGVGASTRPRGRGPVKMS